MKDEVICTCYGVKKNEIINAIENGATTVEEVGTATKAGTGCGGCKETIQSLINEVKGTSNFMKTNETIVATTPMGIAEVLDTNKILDNDDVTDNDEDTLVCSCHNVTDEDIRNAVRADADTVEKIGSRTQAGTGCGKCKGKIQKIIDEVVSEEIICTCHNIEKGEIVEAIENGANTVEEVGEVTKAGTVCGACKATIENIIDKVKDGKC